MVDEQPFSQCRHCGFRHTAHELLVLLVTTGPHFSQGPIQKES